MQGLAQLIRKVFGDPNDKKVKVLWPLVEEVATFEPAISALSDEELKAKTAFFREKKEVGHPTAHFSQTS